MKTILTHFTIIWISSLICTSHRTADKKEYNEILLDFTNYSNGETRSISSMSHLENKDIVIPEQNVIEDTATNYIDIQEEKLIKFYQELELLKEHNDGDNTLDINNEKLNTNTKDNDDNLSLLDEFSIEGNKKVTEMEELNNNLRFKKEIKFSEPRPFEYNYQDPLTGTYSFGYIMHDQYREEKRTADGVTFGNYGWVDPDGKWHRTTFVADKFGYRVVSPDQQVDTAGPPLVIPPYIPTILPYGAFLTQSGTPPKPITFPANPTKPNNELNTGQAFNPSVGSVDLFGFTENEEEAEEEDEEAGKEEEEDGKFDNFFHYGAFLNPEPSINSASLQSPQQTSEQVSLPRPEILNNEFFPPKTQKPFPTFSLPQNTLDLRNEEAVIETNLQDQFFSGLPLKPMKNSNSPKLNKPFQKISSSLLSDWTNKRTWPGKVERVTKPFSYGPNHSKFMRRFGRHEAIETKDTSHTKEKSNIGKSMYNGFDRNIETKSVYSKKKPKTIFSKKPYRFPHISPSLMRFHLGSHNERQSHYINRYAQTPFVMAILATVIPTNNFQQFHTMYPSNHHYDIGNAFLRRIVNYLPFGLLPSHNFIPLIGSSPNFNALYNNFHNPYPIPQILHPYPIIMKPNPSDINKVESTLFIIVHALDLTDEFEPKPTEDDMDYFFLSDEFKKVNGSIVNHPDFADIEDHLSEVANETETDQNNLEDNDDDDDDDDEDEDEEEDEDDEDDSETTTTTISTLNETENIQNNIVILTPQTNLTDWTDNSITSNATHKEIAFKLSPPLISKKVIVPLTEFLTQNKNKEKDQIEKNSNNQPQTDKTFKIEEFRWDTKQKIQINKDEPLQKTESKPLEIIKSHKLLETSKDKLLQTTKSASKTNKEKLKVTENKALKGTNEKPATIEPFANDYFEQLFQRLLKSHKFLGAV